MIEYLWDMAQAVAEIPAREALNGLAVALILALTGSGAWLLARGRVSDPRPALCGLILLVSFGSMAFGFGHSRARVGRPAKSPAGSARFVDMPEPIGHRLIEDADRDGDHRLTPEEAARFVRKVDRTGRGWAGAADFDMARRPRIEPRPIQDFHPDTVWTRRVPAED